MNLTILQLRAVSPGTPQDRLLQFLPHLNKFLPQYGIDTPIEVANFICQVMHESGGMKWLREGWGPTPQQLRYERDFSQPFREDNQRNRLAFRLGNNVKGDGKKYMGRGLIQLTGRSNYTRMSRELFKNDSLLLNPELLATPAYAVQSACVYWKWRDLDRFDDDKDIKPETLRINGGYNGLDDRQRYFERCCKAFDLGN